MKHISSQKFELQKIFNKTDTKAITEEKFGKIHRKTPVPESLF